MLSGQLEDRTIGSGSIEFARDTKLESRSGRAEVLVTEVDLTPRDPPQNQ